MWPLGAWYFLYLIVVSMQNENSGNKIFSTFMLFFISVDQFNCERGDLQQFPEWTETGRLTQILVFLFIRFTKTEVFCFVFNQPGLGVNSIKMYSTARVIKALPLLM